MQAFYDICMPLIFLHKSWVNTNYISFGKHKYQEITPAFICYSQETTIQIQLKLVVIAKLIKNKKLKFSKGDEKDRNVIRYPKY